MNKNTIKHKNSERKNNNIGIEAVKFLLQLGYSYYKYNPEFKENINRFRYCQVFCVNFLFFKKWQISRF